MTGNDWRFRTVIWPDEGIILNVDAGATPNDPKIALVAGVTLAPFSDNEQFLSEWPYLNLPTEPPTSVNQGFSAEQNPFNFAEMLANQ